MNYIDRERLVKRLESYWRFELANVVLVPVLALTIAGFAGARVGLPTLVGLVPNMVLLAIGGLYWRAKLHRLTGRPGTLRSLLPSLDRWQFGSLGLVAIAAAIVAAGWLVPGLSRGRGDRTVGTVLVVLAAAEYVNYYHRQLQHFDNLPDFRRLVSGRGLQRSQLARDLDRYRRKTAV